MRWRAPLFLLSVASLIACSSKSDSNAPATDARDDASVPSDIGLDSAVVVEHEPPCDPGSVAPGAWSLGPSTRVVSIKPKHARLSPEGPKNPVDHDAMVKYLADGLGDYEAGPAEPGVVVDELLPGAGATTALVGRKSFAFIAHLSDYQLVDDESPTRVMAFDTPKIDGAARPQEGSVAHAASAMHRTLTALTKSRPFDFTVVSGDCADNAQQNEHQWFVALMDGKKGLSIDSGDKDDPVPGPGNDEKDPFDPVVIPSPWYFVYGNHDNESQGTSVPDDSTAIVAVGAHAENGTRDYRKAFGPISRDEVPIDPMRAPIAPLAIIDNLQKTSSTPGPIGHGFAAGSKSTNYVVEPIAGVPLRMIELDTTDPFGGSEGKVMRKTVDDFLEPSLKQAEKDGKLVIVVSHHATTNIDVFKGLDTSIVVPGALTGAEVEAIVAAHPNVILWLVGHNHTNRVRAIKGPSIDAPGYYEVMTDAIADWPSESRAIELVTVPATSTGPATLSMQLTMIDYEATDCLEARYRTWSLVDRTSGWGKDGTGSEKDRNVELRRAVPKGVSLDGLGRDKIETETTLVGK